MNPGSQNGTSDIDFVLRMAFGHGIPARPLQPEPGQSTRSQVYALEAPGVPPRVNLLRYEQWDVQRAFRAFTMMRELKEQGYPIARPFYFGWNNHSGYVLLLTEQPNGKGPVPEQPQRFFARVGESFAFTLARLHQLQWERFPDIPTTPFHYALTELVKLVRGLGGKQLQDILDWLLSQAARVEEMPHTVVHGEYALHHVLAHRTAVVAVQGWENAVIADPRLDVGYASAMLGSQSLMLSNMFRAYYIEAVGHMPDLTFWEVFSAVRLLARLRRTLTQLSPSHQEPFLLDVGPSWNNLLGFVEARTGVAF